MPDKVVQWCAAAFVCDVERDVVSFMKQLLQGLDARARAYADKITHTTEQGRWLDRE